MSDQPKSDLDYAKKFSIPGDRYHSVTQFGANTYKITQHYGLRPYYGPGPRDQFEHSDVKLSSSVSRTKRIVLELALANDWDYFLTMTFDPKKVDRYDLQSLHEKFKEWVKYRRKKYFWKFDYLLVPEQHEDGAWHLHGLVRGVMPLDLVSFRAMDMAGYRSENGKRLKPELRNSDYLNWLDISRSFGFCSVGPLRNREAASFYVTKYITKDLERCVSDCGKHMYWPSKGLNRPIKFGEFEDRSPYIDSLLVNKYEFCATGFVLPGEGWDSHLAGDLIESVGGHLFNGATRHPLCCQSVVPSAAEMEADSFAAFEQMTFNLR